MLDRAGVSSEPAEVISVSGGGTEATVKRTVLLLVIMSSTFGFARGRHVTVTVLASTQVGGMSRGDDCVGKVCYAAARSVVKGIAIAAEIDRQHVFLYCNEAAEGRCVALQPGQYQGELKSDSISIKAFPGGGKKSKRIKYSIR